ncbi:MAG: hypothetical protein RXQ99_09560 [Acidianus sp.]|uniref:hypothetical protein n=1 Tax=Acidianus sp. TaxID=1872104 RepID=UPI00397BEDA4
MNETLNYAKRLIISEFEHFLLDKLIAKERYYTIMRSTANCNNWSGIRNELEAKEGIKISDSELSNYLNHLLDSSWLTKVDDRYCPSESLIADSSPPWKVEGSLPEGSSFPPSIRDYISHMVGSRGSQTAPHLKRGSFHR